MTLLISTQHLIQSPPWNWLANLTPWAWEPFYETGYWTSSPTDSRQSGLVDWWIHSTAQHRSPTGLCCTPSCSLCTPMTATPDIERTQMVADTTIISQKSTASKGHTPFITAHQWKWGSPCGLLKLSGDQHHRQPDMVITHRHPGKRKSSETAFFV